MQQIIELKAKAYDLLAALEQLQIELQKVNNQIAELQKEIKPDASRNDSNSSN